MGYLSISNIIIAIYIIHINTNQTRIPLEKYSFGNTQGIICDIRTKETISHLAVLNMLSVTRRSVWKYTREIYLYKQDIMMFMGLV